MPLHTNKITGTQQKSSTHQKTLKKKKKSEGKMKVNYHLIGQQHVAYIQQ